MLETDLAEHRMHLRLGDDFAVPITPVALEGHAVVLRRLPVAASVSWQLQPTATRADDSGSTRRVLHGRVEQIIAVTAPHHLVQGEGWLPVPGRTWTRQVESTCAPDTARSVWIPSGNPVLLAFLLTLSRSRIDTTNP